MQVDFDHYSLRIDGVRRLIRAGSLHYFRLPAPNLWRDRLQKMRAAGLNAVDIYYPWNYHSEVQGEYDFSGTRDIDRLHDMIEQEGLLLIARPGPYICAEIDMGGIPAWVLRDPQVFPRCRLDGEFTYSRDFIEATREWFREIVPRIAERRNLVLVQVENEYTVPTPLSRLPVDLVDLLMRWFGSDALARLASSDWVRRRLMGAARDRTPHGQTNAYIRDLIHMMRSFGVRVPIFHNDLLPDSGRQLDADILALDRYPVTRFDRDWRAHADPFDAFRGDEAALESLRHDNPVFYPELQGGWYDGWSGAGYGRVRELLGPDGIDNATKAALAERATLWNYYVFCGGVTWGYMSSPDVYSSYDYGAPVGEAGRTGVRYEVVRRLNEFMERFEADFCASDRTEEGAWCPEHLVTRQGPSRRLVFLRNPRETACRIPTPEDERSVLEPWETQVRVYGPDGHLEGISPELPPAVAVPPLATPPPLPRLDRWTFCGVSPQLDPSYDDSTWTEIPQALVEQDTVDIDTLGVHHGFIWYRGTFHRPLDRLLVDARHCYAVWVNRELITVEDQLRNTLGAGPDGARRRRIPVRGLPYVEGRNTIVIAVESLGHHKGFADDLHNPRGLVSIDTGSTPISWRFRGGLVRGERGMTPIVAFEGVERGQSEDVVLPHAWADEPVGVGLFETTFQLDGIDPKDTALGLVFDPGRGKANLYLNGYLLGRYWPERGPQRKFSLPWGVLKPDEENHLALALWKRSERAALGKVRLELM